MYYCNIEPYEENVLENIRHSHLIIESNNSLKPNTIQITMKNIATIAKMANCSNLVDVGCLQMNL